MTWSDFDADSALERDMLRRALALVPTTGDGSSRATIDLAADSAEVAIAVGDTLGPTPSRCIELLRIRPLLLGAAWKVLDLLLETALDQVGKQPDTKRGWTINRKAAHANAAEGRPTAFSPDAWSALMRTYAQTVELRHSLVHRRAHTDGADALIGVDQAGRQLRPLSAQEQEAFARSALRASELVTARTPDDRVHADLIRQLGLLTGVHDRRLPTVTLLDALPEIAVIVDAEPGSPDRYRLDVPALKARQPFGGVTYADLIVVFRDRPGCDVRGRLEAAPDAVVVIDPDNPPNWLS
jgi:hypothetical protein